MKDHYFEIYKNETDHEPIETRETFEEAEQTANENGATFICEIGGSFDEFKKCEFCEEWTPVEELNERGDCRRCERAIYDHFHC